MLPESRDDGELRVAMASHDLRGPIHAIKLGLDALRRARLGVAEDKLVQRIYSSTNRLAALVDSFLDSAALHRAAPMIVLQRGPVNLDAVCAQTLDEFRLGHPDRDIKLFAEEGIGGWWDQLRIAELLSNLVENALEHGDASTPVLVQVRRKANAAQIEVVNEGPDIPRELLATIYEPFRRASAPSRRHGVGLGLYIVAQIVAAHDGSIEVSSAGRTTRFTVTLPVDPPESSEKKVVSHVRSIG